MVGNYLVKGVPLDEARFAKLPGHERDCHVRVTAIGTLVSVDIAKNNDVFLFFSKGLRIFESVNSVSVAPVISHELGLTPAP